MIDLNTLTQAKGLELCHLNVRSLMSKADQFKLHFERSNLDVILLSETWLSKDISSNVIEMKNYQV